MTSVYVKRLNATIEADLIKEDGKVKLFFDGVPYLKGNDEVSYTENGDITRLKIERMQSVTNKSKTGPAMLVTATPIVYHPAEIVVKALFSQNGDEYSIRITDSIELKDEHGQVIQLAAPMNEIQTKKETTL